MCYISPQKLLIFWLEVCTLTVISPFILSLVITILISVPESLDILDTSDIEYLSFLCHCCCCSVTSVVSTLCDTIDGSPPGSPVPGTLQARVLEWVAISFSRAWKWKVKGKSLSRVQLLVTPWAAACQAPPSLGFSKQEYWSGVPLPSMHESEKWKWSRSVVSDS